MGSYPTLYSQIKSGEVNYRVKAPKEFNDFVDSTITKKYPESVSNHLKHTYHQVEKAAPYVHFKLIFNRKASLYRAEEVMDIDEGIKVSSVISLSGGKGLFYINTPENTSIRQEEQFNKVWRIARRTDFLNWTIENEYKTIQGYKCQKATTTYAVDLGTNVKLTAWFTAQLPFHFGPNGISGLPGAILGLDYNNFYIYADDIKLSEKETKIKSPTDGRLIALEEFDEINLRNNPLEKQRRKQE